MNSGGQICPRPQDAPVYVISLGVVAEGYRAVQILAEDVRRISSEHDLSDFSRRALNFQWL